MTEHGLEEEILLSYLSSLTLSDNTSVKGWYAITEYVSSEEEKNSHKPICSYVEVWSLGLGLFSCNSLCTQHGINTAGLKIVTVTTAPPWMQSQYCKLISRWKRWNKVFVRPFVYLLCLRESSVCVYLGDLALNSKVKNSFTFEHLYSMWWLMRVAECMSNGANSHLSSRGHYYHLQQMTRGRIWP